jgi:hypothetical protein
VRGGVIILPILEELEEFLRAALFEETHERALDGLHFCAGDLRDLAVTVHKRPGDLLELEVTSNIGVNENLGKFSRCNDKLGDEINSIVAIASELRWRFGSGAEVAVELRGRCSVKWPHKSAVQAHLCEIETSTVTAVIVITVHMQDLLALDGQQAR